MLYIYLYVVINEIMKVTVLKIPVFTRNLPVFLIIIIINNLIL